MPFPTAEMIPYTLLYSEHRNCGFCKIFLSVLHLLMHKTKSCIGSISREANDFININLPLKKKKFCLAKSQKTLIWHKYYPLPYFDILTD